MLLTYGELKKMLMSALREDAGRHESDHVVIDSDDIMASLMPRPQPESSLRGVELYVPYRHKKNFVPATGGFSSDKARLEKFNKLALKPKDVLSVLKHSPTIAGPQSTSIAIKPSSKETAFNAMANKIVSYYNDRYDIDVITYPESGSDMAQQLANRVGAKLGLPVISATAVKKNVDEITIDEHQLDMLYQRELKAGKSHEKAMNTVEKVRAQCQALLKQWKKSGTRPEIKKIRHQQRMFLSLHKAGESAGSVSDKNVLVIDDNIDRGETLGNIKKVLEKSGAKNVYLAAGWDYSERQQ